MVLSAVFILDLKGKVLISRDYRGDIPMSYVDKFMPLVMEAEEEEHTTTPVVSTEDGINFLYIRYNNLYCEFEEGAWVRRGGIVALN
ncbi:AP-1 complex subunit mu-1 [Podochytrium sp. JEL0797]|nr:AP-1 complex subunit mu-1 [Podochytrium sp. JEL0797]